MSSREPKTDSYKCIIHISSFAIPTGRWVAKTVRWVDKARRWMAKLGRWVVKLGRWVAHWLSREMGG
jgi:hypothetical protein